jgi:TRAP-type C4-dicarboxylate transport system permease small subunit
VNKYSEAAARLSKAGAAVGGAALVAMILLITLQVLSRRVLASPLVVADELSGYLLVITTFSALGYGLLRGDQIQVTLVIDRIPDRLRKYLRVAWSLVGAPFIVLIIWRSSQLVLESFQSGLFSVGSTSIIIWPFQAFVPVGFTVLLAQMLAELLDAIDGIRRGT